MTAEVRKVKLDAKRIQSSVLNFEHPSTLSKYTFKDFNFLEMIITDRYRVVVQNKYAGSL